MFVLDACMKRQFLSCAGSLLLFGSLLLHSSAFAADTFSIGKAQYSADVLDDKNYTVVGPAIGGAISRASLTQRRLYFSLTLTAQQQTVQHLRERSRLDVFGVIFCDGIRSDTVPFGITQQRWREIGKSLLQKYEEEGSFPFRTYMWTEQLGCSSIEILVRDGVGNTVGRYSVNLTS